MKLSVIYVILALLPIAGYSEQISNNSYEYPVDYLDSMALTQEPGGGRPYILSAQGASFFYGTTQEITEEGWMGFHWGENRLWNDWLVAIDGELLDRSEATVSVKPHEIVFEWKDGIRVTLTPLGVFRDDLFFEISGCKAESAIDFYLVLAPTAILPEHKRAKPLRFMPFAVPVPNDTVCVGIGSQQTFEVRQIVPLAGKSTLSKYQHRQIWGASVYDTTFFVTVAFGKDPVYVARRLNELTANTGKFKTERKVYLLREINRAYFRCDNSDYNLALNWAKIHLAGMFFNDEEGLKLWAGLPWFNDCWGRDTFISLPGACLVLGKHDEAKALLDRFAKWQNIDETSTDFGKIPNRVRSNDLNYHTADGTPWFVLSVYEYGLYSGDTAIWREFLNPDSGAVWLANEGTIGKRIDQFGFILHDDSETWMDAATPQAAWSPRADRAIEVQALWLTQLEASIEMMLTLQKSNEIDQYQAKIVEKWQKIADKLRQNIPKFYLREDGLGLYDHLNPDGSPDEKIRPNQLFAITVPISPLFSAEIEQNIIKTVKNRCIYEWGVASLAQDDPDFHPYHQTHHYPKDAAYHMGIVWTWLSGAYKTASGQGWSITESEVDQILNWGAFGTLSENLDAVPRDNNQYPYTSGTVSQTWSLAEFIRTWYQDYAGLRYSQGSSEWSLTPRFPASIGDFQAVLPVSDQTVLISREKGDYSVQYDQERLNLVENFPADDYSALDSDLLQPHIPEGLKSLAPPPYKLLTGKDVKAVSEVALPVLNISDPIGDDLGVGKFGYPTGPEFEKGIFDLTNLKIAEDHQNIYFELQFANLVDPGWHPEYGFQLTFVTIAIASGQDDSRKTLNVGYNSNYQLPPAFAADRFIHIGGGIDILDGRGDILSKHIPREEQYALGNAVNNRIEFSVPRDLLGGDSAKWKLTVLVGSQDDHGGAGIGEYREVTAEGGRWQGSSGKQGESNIYDILQHE